MENIINSPYFSKVILTIIAVVVKIALDSIIKGKEKFRGVLKLFSICVFYLLPATIIVWLNIDPKIQNSKLTFTIIAFNIGLIIFNYLQAKIIETSKMLGQLANTEYDKVEKVKQINAIQVEKVKAINENQKYILNEISKINDRIIKYFVDKK